MSLATMFRRKARTEYYGLEVFDFARHEWKHVGYFAGYDAANRAAFDEVKRGGRTHVYYDSAYSDAIASI